MSKSERHLIEAQMKKNEVFCANSVICKEKCNNVCPCRDTLIRYAKHKNKWYAFQSVDEDNYTEMQKELVIVHIVPTKADNKSKDAEIAKLSNNINVVDARMNKAKKELMRSATGKNLLKVLKTEHNLEKPKRASIFNKLTIITESEQTIQELVQQRADLKDTNDSYTGIGTITKKSVALTPNVTTTKNQQKLSMFSKTAYESFTVTTEPVDKQAKTAPDIFRESVNLTYNGTTNFILRPYGLQTVIDTPTEKLQTYSFQLVGIPNTSCMVYVRMSSDIPRAIQQRLDTLNSKRRGSKSMSDIVLTGGKCKDVIKISVNRIKVALDNAKVSFTKTDMYHQFVKNLHRVPKELLKELCIKNGLDSSGKKAELVKSIRRIVNK